MLSLLRGDRPIRVDRNLMSGMDEMIIHDTGGCIKKSHVVTFYPCTHMHKTT